MLDNEKLMKILQESDGMMAKRGILPIRVKHKVYLLNVKGQTEDLSVLKAVVNGYHIDTSDSYQVNVADAGKVEKSELKVIDINA